MGDGAEADARRLFDAFRDELWDDQAWESEFTPSPHQPEVKLRELVDGAGAAAVPLLIEALQGDGKLRFWACVGLEWLGPAAGDAAVDVLAEHVGARRDPLEAAVVALDAIAPARVRALGVHLLPETMEPLTNRHLRLPDDAIVGHVERFVRDERDEDVVRFLGHRRLRDRLTYDCPPRLRDLLLGLLHGSRSALLRREAAEILALHGPVTDDIVEALRHGGPLAPAVVDRVAAHPHSERLVPRLMPPHGKAFAADALAALVVRRRAAGMATDPGPLREFLRLCVDEPRDRWPGPRFGSAVPTAVAALGDETMLPHLLPMLDEGASGVSEWGALIRAFGSFGEVGPALLEAHRQRHPEQQRVGWALDELRRFRLRLDDADDAFLRGRIETPLGGAFASYAAFLLIEPSAHAAFQLAWIDRAYGAPVTAARVAWIRGLGFTDEGLLDDVARPPERPLEGRRNTWDCGEFRRNEPARAARAAAAGLPSLANGWLRDETLDRAARTHLDRVRAAAGR